MLITILGLLLALSLTGNALQAIYSSKLRHELRRARREIESWKLAVASYEKEAGSW